MKRLTVEYSEKTAMRLTEMQTELGFKSHLEVIRIAVKLLSFLWREHNAGWEIVLRKDGLDKELSVQDCVAEDKSEP